MSASVRVRLIVALAALAAAGIAVGVTLATRTDVAKSTSKPPPYAADPTAPPEIASAVRGVEDVAKIFCRANRRRRDESAEQYLLGRGLDG